jgi:hypothetical protein
MRHTRTTVAFVLNAPCFCGHGVGVAREFVRGEHIEHGNSREEVLQRVDYQYALVVCAYYTVAFAFVSRVFSM